MYETFAAWSLDVRVVLRFAVRTRLLFFVSPRPPAPPPRKFLWLLPNSYVSCTSDAATVGTGTTASPAVAPAITFNPVEVVTQAPTAARTTAEPTSVSDDLDTTEDTWRTDDDIQATDELSGGRAAFEMPAIMCALGALAAHVVWFVVWAV